MNTSVHLSTTDDKPACGTNQPRTVVTTYIVQLTGDPRAVTCEACRRTKVFEDMRKKFPK